MYIDPRSVPLPVCYQLICILPPCGPGYYPTELNLRDGHLTCFLYL